jgi:hypothetical protein
MLCVEGNIPISGKMQNGNSSGDTLNNEELQTIANLLKPLRDNIEELIYVADCKLINGNDMNLLDQLKFISRFPANFKQHNQVIDQAIDADQWEELGILAETPNNSQKLQFTLQEELLKNGLRAQGLAYLEALGFDETIYLTPPPRSRTQRCP